MITEKENYLRVLRGEMPEWIPRMTMGPDPKSKRPPCSAQVRPSCLTRAVREDGVMRDWFGVVYESDSQGGPPMPSPRVHLLELEDIENWRDVIKAPDLSDVDWEAMAAKDLEKIDRENTALKLQVGSGYFQSLVSFMGFENALMAPLEAEDETIEILSYVCDFYCDFTQKAIEYYKPDVLELADDNASATRPFFSLDLYRKIYKPFQKREALLAADRGIPVSMHDCGHCEIFIDEWLEFGVRSWNPAQTSNDLIGIKEKYKGRLALSGCWDSQGRMSFPSTGEEEIRAAVRECIDTFAPGGGFCFSAAVMGRPGDQLTADKNRWIAEEYEAYGRNWYQTH